MDEDIKEKIANFLQELFNKRNVEHGHNESFVTNWIVILEMQDLDGTKSIHLERSNMASWEAYGILGWADAVFYETLTEDTESDL